MLRFTFFLFLKTRFNVFCFTNVFLLIKTLTKISSYYHNAAKRNQFVWWRCIKSEFWRRTLRSKPPWKFVQTSYAQQVQFHWPHFLLLIKAHVHSVTHGQLRKQQHRYMYVRRAVQKSYTLSAESGIQGHSRSSLLMSAEIYKRVSS